jgi:hypothetical protein
LRSECQSPRACPRIPFSPLFGGSLLGRRGGIGVCCGKGGGGFTGGNLFRNQRDSKSATEPRTCGIERSRHSPHPARTKARCPLMDSQLDQLRDEALAAISAAATKLPRPAPRSLSRPERNNHHPEQRDEGRAEGG